MRKEMQEKLYDIRVMEKHIYDGTLTHEDLKKFLSSLEDSSSNCEELELEEDDLSNSFEDDYHDNETEDKEEEVTL